MLWSLYSIDKPGSGTIREKTMAAHRAYMATQDPVCFFTGPLQSDGAVSIGSAWIISAGSRAEAEAFAADEPLGRAGVFESTRVFRTRAGHLHPERSGPVAGKASPSQQGNKSLWSLYLLARPDSKAARESNLQAHRDYLHAQESMVFFAGPLQTDDGVPGVGALWIVSAESRAEAQAFLNNEPFHRAGVFQSEWIHRTRGGHFHPELAG